MLTMRERILSIVPNATEVVSYGMPAFRVEGGTFAGLGSHTMHVGYYPFSGSVLGPLASELVRYTTTASAVHVPPDRPLPIPLVRKLIRARLIEIDAGGISGIGLAAPARRALDAAGIRRIADLGRWREADLAEMHGLGPAALRRIANAMATHRVRFRDE